MNDITFLMIFYFQADEHVVNKGLEEHPKERNALRDKPGAVSIHLVVLVSQLTLI